MTGQSFEGDSRSSGPRSDQSLDDLLGEAARAERERPLPDADAFLASTRRGLESRNGKGAWSRVPWRIAAVVPLLVTLIFIFVPEQGASSDEAVIEELHLLQSLQGQGYSPEDLEIIEDVDLIPLLEYLDLLRDSPVELLEEEDS